MKKKTRVAPTSSSPASRGASRRKRAEREGGRQVGFQNDLRDETLVNAEDGLASKARELPPADNKEATDVIDPEIEPGIDSRFPSKLDPADEPDGDPADEPDGDPADDPDGEPDPALIGLSDLAAPPGPIDLSLTPSSPAIRDSLQIYLREVNRFPMLKPDEEFTLIRQYREHNDTKAAFRLISSHLRLVVRIAMDFQRSWMQNILDLIQEGNVGLMKAVQKFDPERGIKFSYYASFWIKAYILKFIMDNWRMVKVGTTQTQRKLFYNLGKERQRLLNQGFDASTASLSKSLNVTEQDITEMDQRLGSSDMSLDAPFSEDTSMTRMDMLPAMSTPVDELLAEEEMVLLLKNQIQKMMPGLNDKERDVLEQRLMNEEPVTLRQIGEKYNITRERVRQIEARLIEKIRESFSRNLATTADKGTETHVERT